MASAAAAAAESHLNEMHTSIIRALFKFFRAKVEEHANEVAAAFSDAKDARLNEDMYSKDDVILVLNGIQTILQSTVKSELEKYAHQHVLSTRTLLLQAEGNGVTLSLDTAKLDDAVLLAGIAKMEIDAKKADALPPGKKLASLTGGPSTVDIKLVEKMKESEDAKNAMQTRYNQIFAQCQKALKENNELKEKVDSLVKQLAAAGSAAASDKALAAAATTAGAGANAEVADLKAKLAASESSNAKLVKENKDMSESLTTKISQTKQFRDLQKIVVTKNKQLKELRAKLAKYDPQAAADFKIIDDDAT